jgi:hypothetical protein
VFFSGGIYINNGEPLIHSNIVAKNTTTEGGGVYIWGSITIDFNDVWNKTGGDYRGLAPDEHDISTDPLLVNPTNGDFYLSSGSPCINAGDPVNYPPMDFEGEQRPQGSAPDIGADEYRSPP